MELLLANKYPDSETKRARNRSAQLQLWVRENVALPKEVYELSIGYNKNNILGRNSASQRKVVLIGIVKKSNIIDFSQALKIHLLHFPI